MIAPLGDAAMAAALTTFVVVAGLGTLANAADSSAGNPAARLWRPHAPGWFGRMRDAQRQRLSQCGLRTPSQRLGATCAALLLLLAGSLGGAWLAGAGGMASVLAYSAGGALLALSLVRWWMREQRAKLLAAREAGLSLALELLCIGVNGGLSLGAAWRKSAEAMAEAREPLAEELRLVELDVGLGRTWRSALEDAATRTGMANLLGLGQLLEQAERFGSELAEAIRTGVDSLLHEQMQDLEERAHRATVKMILPLAAFMLPATLLLILGPLVNLTVTALSSASAD